MTNKTKQFIYMLGFIVGFIILFYPKLADASVNPDTVIKVAGKNNPDVYYVATNGKRYKFPDPNTFTTWYSSFGVVKEVGTDVFKTIPDGQAPVTARPGAKLVTFKGSNRVYAVSSGAIIRWIKKEQIAQKIYGDGWQKFLVEIPIDQVNQYIIGQPINSAQEYNAFAEREKNLSPNAELAHRGFVTKEQPKAKQAPTAEPVAVLSNIFEDVSGNLSPKFNAYHYTYNLNVNGQEPFVGIRAKAGANTVLVMVNGIPTPSESLVRLAIEEGNQIITVSAVSASGKSTTYTVNIQKPKPYDGSAHLASLTENIIGNLQPAFSPTHFEYELNARYPEELVRLVPKSVSKTAIIKIDGVPVASGAARDLALKKGENIIKISVRDGERSIMYTIRVYRQPYLSDDLAKLKELTTDLKHIGSVPFKPDVRDYYLDVDKNRTAITIIAKPADKHARVFINDVETTKSTQKLYAGETTITITVISSEGAKVKYRLFVNRVL